MKLGYFKAVSHLLLGILFCSFPIQRIFAADVPKKNCFKFLTHIPKQFHSKMDSDLLIDLGTLRSDKYGAAFLTFESWNRFHQAFIKLAKNDAVNVQKMVQHRVGGGGRIYIQARPAGFAQALEVLENPNEKAWSPRNEGKFLEQSDSFPVLDAYSESEHRAIRRELSKKFRSVYGLVGFFLTKDRRLTIFVSNRKTKDFFSREVNKILREYSLRQARVELARFANQDGAVSPPAPEQTFIRSAFSLFSKFLNAELSLKTLVSFRKFTPELQSWIIQLRDPHVEFGVIVKTAYSTLDKKLKQRLRGPGYLKGENTLMSVQVAGRSEQVMQTLGHVPILEADLDYKNINPYVDYFSEKISRELSLQLKSNRPSKASASQKFLARIVPSQNFDSSDRLFERLVYLQHKKGLEFRCEDHGGTQVYAVYGSQKLIIGLIINPDVQYLY